MTTNDEMATSDETIAVLNDLIETCKDGEYGFGLCAEYVDAPELRELLEHRTAQCRLAAEELQRQVVLLRGDPDFGGSVSGAAHRGWVSMRGTLAGYSDPMLLEECERGEDIALARYARALHARLPPNIDALIRTQFQGARANHDLVRSLKDRFAAAS